MASQRQLAMLYCEVVVPRNNPISDDDNDDSSTSSRSKNNIASSDDNNESDNNGGASDDSEGDEIIDNETMSNIEIPLTVNTTTPLHLTVLPSAMDRNC
jgi:hypothetical protein